MIELDRVHKTFALPGGDAAGAVEAVAGLSLTVAAGEILCLVGTSGSGKTTTLRLINRMETPTRGVVRVAGEDVSTADVVRLRRGMGWVIQRGGLLPHLPVHRNVALLGEVEGWDAARRRARADALLELVQLDPAVFRDRHPRELSGGQRQRVGVARALFLDPPILLMDEPFGALDPITRAELRGEVRALVRQLGKTVVFVTHDLGEAAALGDRLAVMHEGRLAQVGPPREVLDAPADAWVARFVAAWRETAA